MLENLASCLSIGSQINEVRVDGNMEHFRRDLDHFQRIGLEAVEIPPHGLDAIRNGYLNADRVSEIRNILRTYDFLYTVHAPNPLNLMDRERAEIHLDVFRASLQFALEINAGIVVYHAGRYIPEETFLAASGFCLTESEKKSLLAREAELLGRLAHEFPGIVICIENARPYRHHSPYCYAEDLYALKAQVSRIRLINVRIALDFGHLYMAARYGKYDPVDAVRETAPWIGHCHIHDNFGDAVYYQEKLQTHQIPFGRGDSHMPVGWGDIPFKEIVGALMPNYSGSLIMELRSRYFEHTAASKKNLEELIAPFRMPGLRDGIRRFQGASNAGNAATRPEEVSSQPG